MSAETSAGARHRLHTLRVAAVDELANDAVALTFDVPSELRGVFDFQPGQHVALVRRAGGDELRRSYSVCSPAGGPLRVAVKRLPGGAFSTWVHEELRPGDELDVLPPSGRFTTAFDPIRSRHYAAIAAGSGITPVRSLLASALAIEPGSRGTLIYGNRTTSSIMFLEELDDLKGRHLDRFQWINVLSREAQDTDLAYGRIDRAKLERIAATLVPPETVDEWFLCGPLDLVETAQRTLGDLGVERRRIHRELFHTGDAPTPGPESAVGDGGQGSTVTIVLDGRQTTFTVSGEEASILDAALAVRPDAPYACKGGVCGTCRCRVTTGEVRMDHAYALEDDERRAGLVLACQSHPLTPTVVLDFDVT